MYHEPGMACRIIVACCCLHNLARRHQVPAPIAEAEEDRDGHRHIAGPPRAQPIDLEPNAQLRAGEQQSRAEFIRELFGPA